MLDRTTLPPLALYIHIPWCVRKCPYCDFNSHAASGDIPQDSYITALIADLGQDLHYLMDRRIGSVFIGGGTPSLFSAASLDRLLSQVRREVPLMPDCEITVEANPGAIEAGRFSDLRQIGVNRLSIGVQSFNDVLLERIGRVHGAKHAIAAVHSATAAGFENINLDVMYGLPGQTMREARCDIETATALQPSHISHYQLTIEPNTSFHRYPPTLPKEDAMWIMQNRCQERLAKAGFEHYEVSAFARHGMRCNHNVNYWSFGDYLGIGAGAHSKLTDPTHRLIKRIVKQKHPRQYLGCIESSDFVMSEVLVSREEIPLEFMLNALRLKDGFSIRQYETTTGMPIDAIEDCLHQAEQRGLLARTSSTIRPTALGQRFLNELLLMFFPDSANKKPGVKPRAQTRSMLRIVDH